MLAGRLRTSTETMIDIATENRPDPARCSTRAMHTSRLVRSARAAALLLLTTACSEPPAPLTPPATRGAVAMELGVDGHLATLGFDAVGGMAVDATGRLFIVDNGEQRVRVYDEGGAHVFDIGQQGSGPGEFLAPCCIAFDPSGFLWVRDGGNARYLSFTVGDSSATVSRVVRMQHGDVRRMIATTFDAATGFLIDLGNAPSETGDPGDALLTRFVVDTLGQVIRRTALAPPPADSLAMFQISGTTASGAATTSFFYQPYGPTLLRAFSPNGEWVQAVSSNYAVAWHASDGKPLRVIQREHVGPALSSDEIAEAERRLSRQLEGTGVTLSQLPFGVPSSRTPLRALYFDAEGQLWVELSVAANAPRRADVFGIDGTYRGSIEWPSEVSLVRGVILDEHTAFGIRTDAEGFAWVVRLGFS
jgi:hypothetical protein